MHRIQAVNADAWFFPLSGVGAADEDFRGTCPTSDPRAGGLAVAVASDEAHNGSGRIDEWKRQRLLGVGADVVIPDYQDAEALLNHILSMS